MTTPYAGDVPDVHLRPPTMADYPVVVAGLSQWMAGRSVEDLLPRFFVTHFPDTSVLAETADGQLLGFAIAFESQATPGMGYIHFVWVRPDRRGGGLARRLYAHVFDLLRARGCTMVEVVTTPRNPGAIAFHEHLGFRVEDAEHPGDPAGLHADIAPHAGIVVLTRSL